MEPKQFEEVKNKLYEMTPSLVAEVLQIFEADHDLVNRFGNKLPELTEQEVIRLRNVLIGAIMLDHPPLLRREIEWLVQVASVRNFDMNTVQKHLNHLRLRLSRDLPPASTATVLQLYDKATAKISGLPL